MEEKKKMIERMRHYQIMISFAARQKKKAAGARSGSRSYTAGK